MRIPVIFSGVSSYPIHPLQHLTPVGIPNVILRNDIAVLLAEWPSHWFWGIGADAVSMWSIPIPQRPAGQAMQIITMHLFGDVPTPPIIGAIQGASTPCAVIDAHCSIFGLQLSSNMFAAVCSSHARHLTKG